MNRCTVSDNWARDGSGGGVGTSTVNNCTITGNAAGSMGGGAAWCTLNNCTLTGNSSYYGGGVWSGTLNNCIVYYNTASYDVNFYLATLNYCCTTPWPGGVGNITSEPLFVDYAGGNLGLQSNSPCVNAGLNTYAPGVTDLDGNPRISGAAVDVGAYEFQFLDPFHAWLQQYGLPTDGSADCLDCDGDGHNNWQEWCCRTCPINALSALRLVSASPAGANVTVTWQSVAGVTYHLLRSTNLRASPLFELVATNLPGQAGTTTYTDTNAARLTPVFYRVGVGN